MTIHIPADALTGFCAEVFARVGCRPEEARRVAASLVGANLAGHRSIGNDNVHATKLLLYECRQTLTDAGLACHTIASPPQTPVIPCCDCGSLES
jgi:hypothetical protein